MKNENIDKKWISANFSFYVGRVLGTFPPRRFVIVCCVGYSVYSPLLGAVTVDKVWWGYKTEEYQYYIAPFSLPCATEA